MSFKQRIEELGGRIYDKTERHHAECRINREYIQRPAGKVSATAELPPSHTSEIQANLTPQDLFDFCPSPVPEICKEIMDGGGRIISGKLDVTIYEFAEKCSRDDTEGWLVKHICEDYTIVFEHK